MNEQKICLACSGGGHLTEIMQLKEFFEKKKHFFATFDRQNSQDLAKKSKVYFLTDPKRNPFLFLKTSIESLKIFLQEKPNIVLSTGAGVALPLCFIGKFFGAKIIFVESYCRISVPSASGRLAYLVSDLFVVQWKELKKFYPKAKYVGGFF